VAKVISQKPVQPQPNQRMPVGHFNTNGTSNGKATGSVRPTADACNDCKTPKGSK
jgi:hypothetical protein